MVVNKDTQVSENSNTGHRDAGSARSGSRNGNRKNDTMTAISVIIDSSKLKKCTTTLIELNF